MASSAESEIIVLPSIGRRKTRSFQDSVDLYDKWLRRTPLHASEVQYYELFKQKLIEWRRSLGASEGDTALCLCPSAQGLAGDFSFDNARELFQECEGVAVLDHSTSVLQRFHSQLREMEHTVSAASNVQLLQGDMTRGFASVLHHHVVKRAIPSLDQDSAMDLCKQLQSLTPRRIMELFGLPHFKYKEDALDLQELNGRITFGFGSLFFEGLLAHIEEQLRIKLIELFGWKLGKLSQALEPLHDGLCQYYTDNAIHMVGEMKDLHNGGFPLFTSVYQVTSYRNRQGRPILRGKPHKGARDSFPRFDVDRFIDKCMSKYKIEFSAVEHGAENVTHEDTGTGDFPHNHRYKFLASYGPSIHKEPHKRDRRDQRSRGRRRRH